MVEHGKTDSCRRASVEDSTENDMIRGGYGRIRDGSPPEAKTARDRLLTFVDTGALR